MVTNRCATCGDYWSCHACHPTLSGRPFTPGCGVHVPLYFEL